MDRTLRRLVTAALAATAALLVGCGSTVAGEARPAVMATPKAANVADPAPETEWVRVDDFEVPMDKSPDPAQFGPLPFPGIYIGQDQGSDADLRDCTLGPLVESARGRQGFVTAGHCDRNPGGRVYSFSDEDAQQHVELGVLTDGEDDDAAFDFAVLWPAVHPDPRAAWIAGRFPVVGVMPEAEARALPAGTPICVNGAFTGVTCSEVVDTLDRSTLKFTEITEQGDSGAAVFVLSRRGGIERATLVGILRGIDGPTGFDEATYLEPALARLNVAAVLAG